MIPLKDLELELQNDLIYIFKEDNNTGFCNFRLAISIFKLNLPHVYPQKYEPCTSQSQH